MSGGDLENALENLQAANLSLSSDDINHIADQVELAAGACAQVGGSVAVTSTMLYSTVLMLRECAATVGDGKMRVQSHMEWIKRLMEGGT